MSNLENQIFEIISHAGEARANLYDALKETRKRNYDKADKLMRSADKEMNAAHNVQTALITDDLKNEVKISLLLIHAQDQLMTTMSEQTLIQQMIEMQKQINSFDK
ncbi:PTS lactose/cellobiose transporter subunit IIA [Lactobacillus gasseri]|uniref:PTS lactose/cellobiose transporter subunit IIA n=1 Tax=Lactobacillus gasseri TaxID=1596 RepID=UPI0022E06474|nr:PTS lactose/cellobiose transporter subunit IIA [Lactobacillus gasseri]